MVVWGLYTFLYDFHFCRSREKRFLSHEPRRESSMVDTCCLPILTSNLKIFVLHESRKKWRLEMYTFGWCLLSDLLRIRVYVYPLLYHIGSEKPKKSMWSNKYRIAGTPILVSVKRKCAIWLASVKWSEELLKFRCGPSSVPHCKSLFCYWKPHKSMRFGWLLLSGLWGVADWRCVSPPLYHIGNPRLTLVERNGM